ncbi:hypothetical protein H2201_006358 [Coniosporium apollinis]|uniref:Uncharacterized protein n=1 Tax=Coniosporium apollinis TaxID=61459 RepID=A0ABQ9NMG2_9PEZI|nr:hypothetical protein H2201_006358 [Coniosporium apollinis]
MPTFEDLSCLSVYAGVVASIQESAPLALAFEECSREEAPDHSPAMPLEEFDVKNMEEASACSVGYARLVKGTSGMLSSVRDVLRPALREKPEEVCCDLGPLCRGHGVTSSLSSTIREHATELPTQPTHNEFEATEEYHGLYTAATPYPPPTEAPQHADWLPANSHLTCSCGEPVSRSLRRCSPEK